MSDDVYKVLQRAGSKLKRKGRSLLLDWDPNDPSLEGCGFEAAVRFHEAERLERQAIRSLLVASDETRLNAAIERCACLLEGLDPPGAAQVWGEVLELAERLPKEIREAYTGDFHARLKSSLDSWNQEYAPLRELLSSGGLMPPDPGLRTEMAECTKAITRKFPGVAHMWWRIYRHLEADGDLQGALKVLRERAHPLDPTNLHYLAVVLDLLIQLDEPPAVLDELLEQLDLDEATAPVCILYASAEIRLARVDGANRDRRLTQARHAIFQGLRQPVTEKVTHQHLRVLELFVEALVAGGPVDVRDALFRAGLGGLVADAPAITEQPVEDVVASLSRRLRTLDAQPPLGFDRAA